MNQVIKNKYIILTVKKNNNWSLNSWKDFFVIEKENDFQ